MQDGDDFVGFEKTADGFKPHFQPGTSHSLLSSSIRRPTNSHPDPDPLRVSQFPQSIVNTPMPSVVPSQHHLQLTSNVCVDTQNERTSLVNQTSSELLHTQPPSKVKDDRHVERKTMDKASKQRAQPFKAVPSAKHYASIKPVIANEENLATKRDSSEEREKFRKSRLVVTNKLQNPVGEENEDQGNYILMPKKGILFSNF